MKKSSATTSASMLTMVRGGRSRVKILRPRLTIDDIRSSSRPRAENGFTAVIVGNPKGLAPGRALSLSKRNTVSCRLAQNCVSPTSRYAGQFLPADQVAMTAKRLLCSAQSRLAANRQSEPNSSGRQRARFRSFSCSINDARTRRWLAGTGQYDDWNQLRHW